VCYIIKRLSLVGSAEKCEILKLIHKIKAPGTLPSVVKQKLISYTLAYYRTLKRFTAGELMSEMEAERVPGANIIKLFMSVIYECL
jgi:hypothetical protein